MIYQFIVNQCSCADSLEVLFGLNRLDSNLYIYLAQNGPSTVKYLMSVFERSQSQIYNSSEKLLAHGIIMKKKRTRKRGYEFVYEAVDPLTVKDILEKRLDQLYFNFKSCVTNFNNLILSHKILDK